MAQTTKTMKTTSKQRCVFGVFERQVEIFTVDDWQQDVLRRIMVRVHYIYDAENLASPPRIKMYARMTRSWKVIERSGETGRQVFAKLGEQIDYLVAASKARRLPKRPVYVNYAAEKRW